MPNIVFAKYGHGIKAISFDRSCTSQMQNELKIYYKIYEHKSINDNKRYDYGSDWNNTIFFSARGFGLLLLKGQMHKLVPVLLLPSISGSTNAQIVVNDKTGKVLKQINIAGTGKGTVNIDASTL